jgi:hypothetical protein
MRLEGLLWIVVAVVGLAAFVGFYDRAFPTAAVDLRVTRQEAKSLAQEYLKGRDFQLEGYRSAVLFDSDDLGAIYMQHELGLPKANELARREVPVYFWAARWFRPLQKEEYRVRISPDGRILGFTRLLEEDAPGANLEQEEARKLAEEFLKQQGIDLAQYESVEASSERLKERTDHTFVWKRKDFQAAEAELRLRVVVQGDQIGSYGPFLKVPEDFERAYAREQSVGTLVTVAMVLVLTLALAIGALVIFMRAYKAGELRWRFALGIAAVLLVLLIAGTFNGLPLLEYQHQTEMDYATFLGLTLAVTLVVTLIYGLWILLKGGAGEYLTRQLYPRSLQTLNDLLQRRFTREVALSSLRGYALAFGFLGYLVLFYLIGQRFLGIWLPAEGPYTNILNTAAPFLYPLLVGLTAAVTEEFAYRFFAIPFLKRYVRWTFLALLIPAVIWAFAHASYPVSPVYVRGIELTIAGLVFGYCFIRYDLWTVLVAHYGINALIVGLPLLQSGNAYFQISGIVVIALGLVPALLALPGLRRPPAPAAEAA